jgi:predicted HicB family RNase H-like nuclease
MAEETVTTSIRMPKELHQQLVRAAEQERRSLNSLMVVRLEQTTKKGQGDEKAMDARS